MGKIPLPNRLEWKRLFFLFSFEYPTMGMFVNTLFSRIIEYVDVLVKAVTRKYLGGSPVDRNRLNAHPGLKATLMYVGRPSVTDRYLKSKTYSSGVTNTPATLALWTRRYSRGPKPNPVSQKAYDRINAKIADISEALANASMKKAAAEEKIIDRTVNSVVVNSDGTWKTRGHTSLIGVCALIGADCGKVLDMEVMSSYCKGCDSDKGPKLGPKYSAFWLNITFSAEKP
ncbi:uncharacterized protein TNCV_4717901 [Trichonephila clavipes]|nr:uncharacterized protein TNCV_4717901 [Trichonephila clavipes]